MKIILVISFSFFLLTLSCVSKKTHPSNENLNFTNTKSTQLSSIISDNDTGKIEVMDLSGEVYFVQNWESRSRVALKITGNLKEEIKKLNGNVIRVKGNITKKSDWSGSIEITEIIEVMQTNTN